MKKIRDRRNGLLAATIAIVLGIFLINSMDVSRLERVPTESDNSGRGNPQLIGILDTPTNKAFSYFEELERCDPVTSSTKKLFCPIDLKSKFPTLWGNKDIPRYFLVNGKTPKNINNATRTVSLRFFGSVDRLEIRRPLHLPKGLSEEVYEKTLEVLETEDVISRCAKDDCFALVDRGKLESLQGFRYSENEVVNKSERTIDGFFDLLSLSQIEGRTYFTNYQMPECISDQTLFAKTRVLAQSEVSRDLFGEVEFAFFSFCNRVDHAQGNGVIFKFE